MSLVADAVKNIALVIGGYLERCACHTTIWVRNVNTHVLIGVEAPGRPTKHSTARAAAVHRNSDYVRIYGW